MLPWQTKSIFVIGFIPCVTVFVLSIAYRHGFINEKMLMRVVGNCGNEFAFGPLQLLGGAEIPVSHGVGADAFKNDHIQRPWELHRLAHQGGAVFICPIEIPHTAQIARRKAGYIGIGRLQIFGGDNGSAFLGATANQHADLTVERHLWHSRLHDGIQFRKEAAEINWFPDIHEHLLSGAVRLFLLRRREKHGQPPRFSLCRDYMTCAICS